MSEFLEKTNWHKIKRGSEYDAALIYPSDTKRPLSFFEPNNNNNPLEGKIVRGIGDFSANFVEGKPQASVQQIVMQIKPRKVVVLSNDEINESPLYEYIQVAPINTIKDHERQKEWYKLLKEDGHPIFAYIPNGRLERYVDLSQTMSIHKSLLLKYHKKVNEDRMEIIEDTLLQLYSLGLFEDEE